MGLRIHILTHDGSPLGVTSKSIFGEDGRVGVGGAELALLTMCEAWHKEGHDVVLYNNPNEANASPFEQRQISDFEPDAKRDFLIIFRSPHGQAINANGKKIWWSCDQQTIGDFKAFSKEVDKIVTISRFHSAYFKNIYGILDTVAIDLPVRTQEYRDIKALGNINKVPKRCIFTSMPDRGLMPLNAAWPLIVRDVPDASLVITSDWRLWDAGIDESPVRPYRLAFAHQKNVTYLGAVNRGRLIEEQLRADLHIYPGIYDELFCISLAESQVAGVFPVTSNYGALGSTNMGMVISGNPQTANWINVFVAKVVELLTANDLKDRQSRIQELAIRRFNLSRILEQWQKKVFDD